MTTQIMAVWETTVEYLILSDQKIIASTLVALGELRFTFLKNASVTGRKEYNILLRLKDHHCHYQLRTLSY